MRLSMLSAIVLCCTSLAAQDGPHLANGIKIGEVTPNSAIVWVRLTAAKERVAAPFGSPPPVARPPDVRYASDEVAAPPAPAAADASPRPEAPQPEPGVPEPGPASVARVRRDEEAHAGELLDR